MIELNKIYFKDRQGELDTATPIAFISGRVYFNKVWIIQTDLTMALV